jgi:hypothetical protein
MKAHHDNAPKEINNWKVYGLAIVACMAAVMIGYDVSIPSFNNRFRSLTDHFALLSVRLHRYLDLAQSFQGRIWAEHGCLGIPLRQYRLNVS